MRARAGVWSLFAWVVRDEGEGEELGGEVLAGAGGGVVGAVGGDDVVEDVDGVVDVVSVGGDADEVGAGASHVFDSKIDQFPHGLLRSSQLSNYRNLRIF